MHSKPEVLPAPQDLRERALARIASDAEQSTTGSASDSGGAEHLQTLHELRVHQIELEMQNEELRHAQRELEISRRRWFELYDLAPVSYCTVDERGVIVQLNLAGAELLGLPRAAVVQRCLSAFVHADDLSDYYRLFARLVETGVRQHSELRVMHADGSERWVDLAGTASATEAVGHRELRIVLIDISARRQAQAAEVALQLAEQASRDRIAFLSRVSHEFRTPLNAILGFSQLLLRDADRAQTPMARLQLQHIHDAGAHLTHMVTDLLDMSSAMASRLAVHVTAVDLIAMLRDAVLDIATQAEAAGVAVDWDLPAPGALAHVSADPTRLRQVVQNLLTNAVKYNRPGGRLKIRVTGVQGFWRLQVIDTGIGMTPQQLQTLFEPFNRLGRETSGIPGTGLGLVIARDLILAMGGRMDVRSEAGQGSEFVVDLPVAQVPATAEVAGHPGPLPVRSDLTGRVLCVEDDPVNRALIRAVLDQRPGLRFEVVETGTACIAAARRAWPDLLLLDQRLPDMAGLDVLKVIRQMNPHLPMRCIVVSAEALPDEIVRAKAAGADDYLAKPIDVEVLLDKVDQAILAVNAARR